MDIKVSVLCAAYNHEKYIRDCLEGFVSQKTEFSYEVLVNDDASTDNTAKIIREYEEKYPDIIKGIYHEENQTVKGRNVNIDILLPLAHGKYIAFCEGDDYWCDPEKLQKQYNAMEKHPECYMAVHRTRRIYEDGRLSKGFIPVERTKEGLITSYKFITTKGGFHVSSYFVKADALKEYSSNIPSFQKVVDFSDVPYQLYFGNLGPVYCVNDVMSHYRMKSVGGWSATLSAGSVSKMDEHYDMVARMFAEYDKYTKGKYHDFCAYKQKAAAFRKHFVHKEYGLLLSKPYRDVFMKQSFKQKLGIIYRAVMIRFRSGCE